MKVLFMGTPQFAAESLKALTVSKHSVVCVVTQPDRALKRGKVEISPVKRFAEAHGLPIFQPVKIRAEADKLRAYGADIAVTAAYGQILDAAVLDSFPCGIINVHASLLPKYRGASPIQSAIAAGDTVTGVTIMRTELGIDTGDILASAATEIGASETAGELTERLARLGAELLVKTLDCYDRINPIKQDDSKSTHCKTISKTEQYIDFSLSAKTVANKIRALSPSPCAKTVICNEVYKIFSAETDDVSYFGKKPGEIVECGKDRLVIACGDGCIRINTIQAPSKRAMSISEFLRGNKFDIGVICAKQTDIQ